jgi:hypothetical protein
VALKGARTAGIQLIATEHLLEQFAAIAIAIPDHHHHHHHNHQEEPS